MNKALFAFLFLLPVSGYCVSFQDDYTIRTGDYNSDGIADYYLEPPEKLVPIANLDVTFFVPAKIGHVIVVQKPAGGSDTFEVIREPSNNDLAKVSGWVESSAKFDVNDYDSDGTMDFYMLLEESSPEGVHGLVVYGNRYSSDDPGYGVIDNYNAWFAADIANYAVNENYYAEAGTRIACYTSYSISYDPYYNPEYPSWYYIHYFVGTTYCVYYWDPSVFSPWSLPYSFGLVFPTAPGEPPQAPQNEEEEKTNREKASKGQGRRQLPGPVREGIWEVVNEVIKVLKDTVITIGENGESLPEEIVIEDDDAPRWACGLVMKVVFDADGFECEVITEETFERSVDQSAIDGSYVTFSTVSAGLGVQKYIEGGYDPSGLRKWCTYTLTRSSPSFAEYYGRTSGSASISDDGLIERRYRAHRVRQQEGFRNPESDGCVIGPAKGWRNEQGYRSKRGREQQLIDKPNHICAVDNKPRHPEVGNLIRGVSRVNVKGCDYWTQSNSLQGFLQTFTGDIVNGDCPARPTSPPCAP